MLDVKVICIGKLKESYLRDGCGEYIKRLSRFCKIEIAELAESLLPDSPSQAQILSCISKEGKAILSKIPRGHLIVPLCIEGTPLSSEELSEFIEQGAAKGATGFSFIIGSSFGLSDEVKAAADLRLSMSKMTFPHPLARMMLLEQLYRAFQISSGGKYHK